jgi:hypothetical protein
VGHQKVVQPVEEGRPRALRARASSASRSAAPIPSLSRTSAPHRVAERLLVAEDEGEALARAAQRRVHDPLEAGERLPAHDAAVAGEAREQARRDHGGDDEARLAAGVGVVDRVVGEQHPHLVAGEDAVAGPERSGTAAARRSASGSLASTSSAPVAAARASTRSIAPGSSGLGKGRCGRRRRDRPERARPRPPRSRRGRGPGRRAGGPPRAWPCRRSAGEWGPAGAGRLSPGRRGRPPPPRRPRRRRAGAGRARPPRRARAGRSRPPAARPRCARRSRRRPGGRSAPRSAGRPCNRCPRAGCGWP